ncbi:ribonuclease J [Patescibacteria group bacterium]|nr:ribonuclease J [Patescibacteria group bacterium]MCL5091819.1 ribonuclease J [Patescibacteria group bacterium]
MNLYKLRFLSLGGIVGVTKNMYVYELYKNVNAKTIPNKSAGSENYQLQDIVIVDCGIGFPQEKELGVDFVIPDIGYLEDKVDKIRAVLLTHGHEDHITALPYHYDKLGRPPIYASRLTAGFLTSKFKEFGQSVAIKQIEYRKDYRFGEISARFIHVTHSIPDATHILLKTPVGSIYHGADFKLDLMPPYGDPPDFYEIARAGEDKLLCLLSDSLGAEREGLALSEAVVGQTFEDEMRKTKGKFIMTTFSSNISRIRQCVEAAIKFNRKIVFMGRSMRENTTLAQGINYLPIPHSLFGKEQEIVRLPPNRVCLIVAGSQGQYNSALAKIAHNQNKSIKIKTGDKVLFSSDPIPGNENEVYALIEELALRGADVVYSDIQDQLHASGHGNREDLKYLIRLTKPKYLIPIGGTIRHQRQYQQIAQDLGYAKDKILLLQEGEAVVFTSDHAQTDVGVETDNIYVDAYGVGDVGNVILRDRKTLSFEGMVVAVVTIDKQGHLLSPARVITRGFVFEKAEPVLMAGALATIKHGLSGQSGIQMDITGLKRKLVAQLEDYFFKETGRRPLLMVEIIQV